MLRVETPETIAGSFVQSRFGAFDAVVAGDSAGRYGALAVSSLATLDGRLALDLADGFSLAAGDVFALMTFAHVAGDFRALTLDGVACRPRTNDVWSCANLGGLRLQEVFGDTFLNLDVLAPAPFAVTAAAATAAPEPAAWAMLLIGLLGLFGLGRLRGRRGSAADCAVA